MVILFALAVYFRLFNFADRVNFGPEQGLALLTAASNLHNFSLLGMEDFRVTSFGHTLFIAPWYTYFLIPLQLIFSFDPLPITFFFTLSNLATAATIYFLASKMFGKKSAALATILFLFNWRMISHSLFIWSSNYSPLLGLLAFYLLYRRRHPFLLGLICGFGPGLNYFFFVFSGLFFLISLLIFPNRKKTLALFILGAVIAWSPTLLFELRHNFYHIRTLWQYFLDTLANPGQARITFFHFFPIWGISAVLLGLFLSKIPKPVTCIILAAYLAYNLSPTRVLLDRAQGTPPGLTAQKIAQAAAAIAADHPQNFNVAALVDFDTRAYNLRYLLEYRYQVKPMDIYSYPGASKIYVLAGSDYPITNPRVWELSAFLPYKSEILARIDPDYLIYRLSK